MEGKCEILYNLSMKKDRKTEKENRKKERQRKKDEALIQKKGGVLSETAKNRLQWGLLLIVPVVLTVAIVGAVIGIKANIDRKANEHEWVSAVVYDKEFKQGYCAWMWCYNDEYIIYFEYENKRSHASVDGDAYHSIDIGETVQVCLNHGEVKYSF